MAPAERIVFNHLNFLISSSCLYAVIPSGLIKLSLSFSVSVSQIFPHFPFDPYYNTEFCYFQLTIFTILLQFNGLQAAKKEKRHPAGELPQRGQITGRRAVTLY
ncbi:hypothetical protein CLOM621_05292 [Clostridium sp. M62/1]|nr:hypothetical protein CLOM621_05292 [Clostridium sp. M62/1]